MGEDKKIEASSKETLTISASFTSGVYVGTGMGLGFSGGLGVGFGVTYASSGVELSRTLEQRYAEGRISTNKGSSTSIRAGLISAKV